MTMYGSLMWLHNRHVTDAHRHMIRQARWWVTPCREDDYKKKKAAGSLANERNKSKPAGLYT